MNIMRSVARHAQPVSVRTAPDHPERPGLPPYGPPRPEIGDRADSLTA